MTEHRPTTLASTRRIAVYGVTGAGKSTLARQLADVGRLPFHAVDDLAWEPGWVEVPVAELLGRVRAIVAGDAWVLDAVYSSMLDEVLPRVDLLVALDFRRFRSFGRLIWRTGRRLVRREQVCNGNHETLRRTLSRDSILLWHATTFARRRDRIAAWADASSGPPIVRLRSPRDAERWLAELRTGAAQAGSV